MISQSFVTVTSNMIFVVACGMLVTGIVVPWAGDWTGAGVLTGCGLTALVAYGLIRRTLGRPSSLNLAVNSVSVSLGWFLTSLFAALPIWIIAKVAPVNGTMIAHQSWINAWYDGVAAITSAGLTSSRLSSELTPAVQLWRSVGQWIGGVGMAVLATKLVTNDHEAWNIYQGETRQWKSAAGMETTLRRILICYSILTVVCIVLFSFAGMPAWETLNHSLIIVSTGGLTITNDSFMSYSTTIQTIAGVFMFLGAISFSAIYLAMTGQARQLARRSDVRGTVAFFFTWCLILALFNLFDSVEPTEGQLFNAISALTTCGVSAGPVTTLPGTILVGFIVIMLIGGSSDSTTGGFKSNRLLWLTKLLQAEVRRVLHTNQPLVMPTWNQLKIDKDTLHTHTHHCLIIFMLLTGSFVAGVAALRITYEDSISMTQIAFQTASAIGTVGLSMDLYGPDRPTASKVIEIILMVAGRLEFMAIILIPFVLAGRAAAEEDSAESSDEVA